MPTACGVPGPGHGVPALPRQAMPSSYCQQLDSVLLLIPTRLLSESDCVLTPGILGQGAA